MREKQKQTTLNTAVAWHALAPKEVFERVKSRQGGLTQSEVGEHAHLFGRNRLHQVGIAPMWKVLLSQLTSPLVYILFAAAIISGWIGDWLEVAIILAAVVINTVVGFWQEYKADRALWKLTNLLRHFTTVERDGRQQRIDADGLVVGDVIVLRAGESVGADARLFETHRLQAREASLTGESVDVDKDTELVSEGATVGDRTNMLFAGTTVTRGMARAVVVAVGVDTQMGRIAQLVQDTGQDLTPLQRQLIAASRFLTYAILIASVLLFLVGRWYGQPAGEFLVTVAALAVAAVPEGLLVSLTVVLVIGMQRLLKKRGLVRKLVAAETLGAVTVVCTDKTGTLTKGRMQVAKLIVHGEIHEARHQETPANGRFEAQHLSVLKAGLLCNDAYIRNPGDALKDWDIVGDQTDAALLVAAVQAGFDREKVANDYLRLDEIPFDERYKFMATLHHHNEKEHVLFVKGAPETVLAMCDEAMTNGEKHRTSANVLAQLREEYQNMASSGLRVLAVASKTVPTGQESFGDLGIDVEKPVLKGLVFDGWVGLQDPVRPEVKSVFVTMRQAGVRPIIITGDHPQTVRAIANELGWVVPDEEIMIGEQLNDLPVEALIPFVSRMQIFARVEPKHKVRIVEALRQSGEVVAMFGDGVNDAPALKAADIAVVVNSGADIAKDTADLILLDDHFGVITSAIREGRVMFDNIQRIFLFLVSDSFAEVIIIAAALVLGLPLPLTAIQILWKNLIEDGLPNLALTVEKAQVGVMRRRPRRRDGALVNTEIKWLLAAISLATTISGFASFAVIWQLSHDLTLARTVCFTAVGIDSLIYVFSLRRLDAGLWQTNLFSNKALIAAVVLSICLQVAAVYVPVLQSVFGTVSLTAPYWLFIIGLALAQIVVIEAVKYVWRHRFTPDMVTV